MRELNTSALSEKAETLVLNGPTIKAFLNKYKIHLIVAGVVLAVTLVLGWFPYILGASIVIIIGYVFLRQRAPEKNRGPSAKEKALRQFAKDNGFTYTSKMPSDDPDSLALGPTPTGNRRIRNRFTQRTHVLGIGGYGRQVEIGNWHDSFELHTIRVDRDNHRRRIERWEPKDFRRGYIRIWLPVQMPNIVLDATQHNKLSGRLPRRLDPSLQISLGPEWDQHFNLYAPVGFEEDAVELFTPELLQQLRDIAPGRGLDAEVIGDRLYIFGSWQNFVENYEGGWDWQLPLIEAVLAAFDRWQLWRAENPQLPALDLGTAVSEEIGGDEMDLPEAPPAHRTPTRNQTPLVPPARPDEPDYNTRLKPPPMRKFASVSNSGDQSSRPGPGEMPGWLKRIRRITPFLFIIPFILYVLFRVVIAHISGF